MVTAEVADYYHLGNLCLQEFFRVLKPGGSLAMYEYWYVAYSELPSDTPQDLIESNKRVSRYAAMPTRERLTRGVLQSWVKEQGFIDVNEADLSDNIRPMFFRLADSSAVGFSWSWDIAHDILSGLPFLVGSFHRLRKLHYSTISLPSIRLGAYKEKSPMARLRRYSSVAGRPSSARATLRKLVSTSSA
ncbi:MAG: hypothetical protein L6R41_007764 [Letrouitia leprolyta]|nr:MAG: hypothetical protein L6R41_007764 [Letrouitia leprolyta]